jgi:hypothetical protein
MRSIRICSQEESAVFARKASEHFRDNPRAYTFAEGDPVAGELMAIRWNSFAVLLIRLSEDSEPSIYATAQFFPGDLPPLQGGM